MLYHNYCIEIPESNKDEDIHFLAKEVNNIFRNNKNKVILNLNISPVIRENCMFPIAYRFMYTTMEKTYIPVL